MNDEIVRVIEGGKGEEEEREKEREKENRKNGKSVSGRKIGCRLRFLFSHFRSTSLRFPLQSFLFCSAAIVPVDERLELNSTRYG